MLPGVLLLLMLACLNALTGIDGIWTQPVIDPAQADEIGLNALTGIDGIWTEGINLIIPTGYES